MKNRALGFTLMELLVVIAIILILAGMLTSANQSARRRASISRAKAEIAMFDSALEQYQEDIGSYPQGDIANVINALVNQEDNPDWYGPYLDLKQEQLNQKGEFVDPWGHPYKYVYPGVHRKYKYDLYSFGPNGEDDNGEKDDINNW